MDKMDLAVESRLSKLETRSKDLSTDIKDIKKTLRWLTGIVFSLNSTILGVMTKGFGIL